MKRLITRWTTIMATAAVLGLPVAGFANTRQAPAPQPQPTQPQPAQPPATQPQPASPAVTPQQPAQPAQVVSPQEHLGSGKGGRRQHHGDLRPGEEPEPVRAIEKASRRTREGVIFRDAYRDTRGRHGGEVELGHRRRGD